jgi:hypothetical protein
MIATVRVFFNALVMAARTGVGAIARESKARRPKTTKFSSTSSSVS